MDRTFDVIVIGAGPAGLTAALVLGRSRRLTLVLDSSSPRNRFAAHAHNVFTRDNTPPLELLRIGREQLAPYPTVEVVQASVRTVTKGDLFQVETDQGETLTSRTVLVATGIEDTLPPIAGMQELWGKSVIMCPFCHGFEFSDKPTAILGQGDVAYTRAEMLYSWSRNLFIVSNGPSQLSDEQQALLARRGVGIYEQPIARVEYSGDNLQAIVFANGDTVPAEVLYLVPEMRPRLEMLADLGVEIRYETMKDIAMHGQTNVPGLYVAGDASGGMQAVNGAVYSGNMLAVVIHHHLAHLDFVAVDEVVNA